MSEKKCLLMIGSPKGWQSSSYKIGNYLFDKILEKGYSGERYLLKTLSKRSGDSSGNIDEFINDIRESDIIILSCPLYVDSIPSFTIEVMELIADEYNERSIVNDSAESEDKQNNNGKEQGFLAIINSGFPESEQNDTAIKICRRFAKEVGFKWLGGIGVGGGAAVGNQELKGNKGMLKKLVAGLDKTSDAIVNEHRIPEDARHLLNRPLIPSWFYTFILNPGWWFMARKNKAHKKIYDKPYLNKDKVL
ncbi:MAG: hypothetical protein ACLFUI_07095 [Halanaerobiales bacterium]